LRNFKVVPLLRDIESLGKGEEEALEALLHEEISGVVFVPGHRSRFNQLIDRFAERDIPVVTVSTDAPLSKRLTTICVNPRKNGELAGELMSHFVPRGSKVAVMVDSPRAGRSCLCRWSGNLAEFPAGDTPLKCSRAGSSCYPGFYPELG